MDNYDDVKGIEYADPATPINYEPFRLDYRMPEWKDVDGKHPYTKPRHYGADRLDVQKGYWSQDVAKKEWDRLWTRTWHWVGHLNDIPEENCYMRVRLGVENILVVRGPGEELRAFYNVCQHRGKDLAQNDFGKASQLICPFHRWEFNMDGTLRHIADRETFHAKAVCHNLDIPKVRVEQWRGWIFINLDIDAQPLLDYIPADFRAIFDAYDCEKAIRVRDVVQTWPCNWKLAHEAFNEGYHVRATHAQLQGAVDPYHCQVNLYENGFGRSVWQFMTPIAHIADQIGKTIDSGLAEEHKIFLRESGVAEADFPTDLRDVPKVVVAAKKAKQGYAIDYSKFTEGQLIDDWSGGFFPSTEAFFRPEGFFIQHWRLHPSDPEKCIYSAQTYVVPGIHEVPSYFGVEGEIDLSGKTVIPRDYRPDDDLWAAGPVVSQDMQLLGGVQQGVHSRGFKGNVLSDQEIRIRQWYDEYSKYMNDLE